MASNKNPPHIKQARSYVYVPEGGINLVRESLAAKRPEGRKISVHKSAKEYQGGVRVRSVSSAAPGPGGVRDVEGELLKDVRVIPVSKGAKAEARGTPVSLSQPVAEQKSRAEEVRGEVRQPIRSYQWKQNVEQIPTKPPQGVKKRPTYEEAEAKGIKYFRALQGIRTEQSTPELQEELQMSVGVPIDVYRPETSIVAKAQKAQKAQSVNPMQSFREGIKFPPPKQIYSKERENIRKQEYGEVNFSPPTPPTSTVMPSPPTH